MVEPVRPQRPPRPALAPTVVPAVIERFQRSLREAWWPRSEPLPADGGLAALEPVEPVAESGADDRSPGEEHGDEPSERDPGERTEPPPVAIVWTPPMSMRDDERPPAVPQAAAAGEGEPDAPPAWMQDTLQWAQWICAHAAALDGLWQATVPLDAGVLPHSEVTLALSPHVLALRFRLGSPEAAALVSQHRSALQAHLRGLPAAPADIHIELE